MQLAYHGPSDGASYFSGNGFIPFSQPPPFAFTQTAAGDPSSHGMKGSLKNAGIMPLTVKQTSQAMQHPFDDNFSVDGADVNIVTLVGMVLNKEERSTDVCFVLDDGTGSVDVKCWIDGQDVQACTEALTAQNGDYVRLYGHLRSYQGRRNIVALSIRLTTDFNEITFHFLDCIYVRLFNGKMGSLGSLNASGGIISTFMRGTSMSPFHDGLVDPGAAVSGGYVQDSRNRVAYRRCDSENKWIQQKTSPGCH